MDIATINQLLTARLATLNDARARAISVGDIEQINTIDKDLMSTKNSLQQLTLLTNITTAATNANTTPAEVVASGIDAVLNIIQGPSASAIVSGYDISAYATDPNHEQKIQNIINAMPMVNVASEIDIYIKEMAPESPITGEMVLNAGNQYVVDIPLLLAIMQNDSMFGTLGIAVNTLNPGNVGNDGTNIKTYPSWVEGVNAVAEWLNRHRITETIQ